MMELLESYKKLGISPDSKEQSFNPADSVIAGHFIEKIPPPNEDTQECIFEDKGPAKFSSSTTQTSCDKEIQAEVRETVKPSAIGEIKNLRSDLSNLTQSMKSFSNSYSNSFRAS